MISFQQQTDLDEQEISLLNESLPKISEEYRAYIKGAIMALLFAQEEFARIPAEAKTDDV